MGREGNRSGKRWEANLLTFGNVDNSPPLQKPHHHGLQRQQTFPTPPLPNKHPPHRLPLPPDLIHQLPIFHCFLPNQHSRPPEQSPSLCRFERFHRSQLIDDRPRYPQHLSFELFLPQDFIGDILHALHFERVGVGQDDSLAKGFSLAGTGPFRFVLIGELFLLLDKSCASAANGDGGGSASRAGGAG